MRDWSLWKREAVFRIRPWPWPGEANPAMHRPPQSWTDEPSDERCCFGLSGTSEHFPGLRTKLSMEICCKRSVLMCLGRLWIQQSRKEPYICNVWSLKMWMQLFQPQSPFNIINSNIIWQRFAVLLDIWYLWHLANFPPALLTVGIVGWSHSSWASITKHGQRGLSSSRCSSMCLAAVY